MFVWIMMLLNAKQSSDKGAQSISKKQTSYTSDMPHLEMALKLGRGYNSA